MIDEEELTAGQNIYKLDSADQDFTYLSNIIVTMTVLTYDGSYFKNEYDTEPLMSNKNILNSFFLTEDEAKIDFYKHGIQKAKEAEQKLKSKIKNTHARKKEMHEAFGHLKKEYPEEFI